MPEQDALVKKMKKYMDPEVTASRFNVDLSKEYRLKLNRIKKKLDVLTDADWLRGVIDYTFDEMFSVIKPED